MSWWVQREKCQFHLEENNSYNNGIWLLIGFLRSVAHPKGSFQALFLLELMPWLESKLWGKRITESTKAKSGPTTPQPPQLSLVLCWASLYLSSDLQTSPAHCNPDLPSTSSSIFCGIHRFSWSLRLSSPAGTQTCLLPYLTSIHTAVCTPWNVLCLLSKKLESGREQHLIQSYHHHF